MSQTNLNHDVNYKQENPGYFEFNRKNPIMIEKSFYLEKEDNQIGCVMLNQIILNIAQGEIGGTHSQNHIAFSLLPFLTPDILPEGHDKKRCLKRLRKPVMYDIEPLPDKLEVNFETGDK